MSSECDYEIDNDRNGDHQHRPSEFLENPQEMIIANDIEAEAEDDMDDSDIVNAIEFDIRSNPNDARNDDNHEGDDQSGDDSSSDDDDDDDDSQSSGSGSSSSSSSSNSGSSSGSDDNDDGESSDENNNNNDDDKDGQQKVINAKQENHSYEEEDEDEEIDIDPMMNDSKKNLVADKNPSSPHPEQTNDTTESNQIQLDLNPSTDEQKQEPDDQLDESQSREDHNQHQDPRYQNKDEIDKNCDENGVYKWEDFDGVKIKTFTKSEYESFQVPFKFGWKRELVLRCSGSTADKKAGDVYYHIPNGSSKLRSYVEMNQYLKRNPQITNLNATNFTFAKQPVYRPPDEIVRHAMQRGANFVDRPFAFNQHIRSKHLPRQTLNNGNFTAQQQPSSESQPNNSNNKNLPRTMQSLNNSNSLLSNEDSNDPDLQSNEGGILGRGKRKRVLPSRYDDTEIMSMPVNKKSKQQTSNQNHQNNSNVHHRESYSNSNSNDGHSPQSIKSTGSSSKMSAQERRRALQQQLYQQVNEEVKREREQKEQASALTTSASESMSVNGQKQQNRNNGDRSLKMKIIKQQNGNRRIDNNNSGTNQHNNDHVPSEKASEQISENSSQQQNENEPGEMAEMEKSPTSSGRQPPCSNNCPNRRNMVPNLMCCRCFCLFHLECVPGGVFLRASGAFVCPNCLTEDDRANAEDDSNDNNNSSTVNNVNHSSVKSTGKSSKKPDFRTGAASNPNSLLLKQQKNPMMTGNTQQSVKYRHIDASNHQINGGKKSQKMHRKQQQIHQQESGIMDGLDHQIYNGSYFPNKMAMINHQNPYHVTSSTPMAYSLPLGGNHQSSNKYHHHNKHSLSRKIVPPLVSSNSINNRLATTPPQPSSPNHKTNVVGFQPGISHVYRLAQAVNGQQVVIKDRTQPIYNLATNGQHNGSVAANNLITMNYHLKQATKLLNEKQALLNVAAQQLTRTQYYSTLNDQDDNAAKMIRPTGLIRSVDETSKWLKYQSRMNNIFNRLDSMIIILSKLVDYLDLKDLINLGRLNKQWYQMMSIPLVWQHIRLRGLTILDWSYFVNSVVQIKPVKTIDLIGIRIPINSMNKTLSRNEKMINFWQNFSVIHANLIQIETLKFGLVPLFVIKSLINFYNENQINIAPIKLKKLIIMNVFDECKPPNDCCSCEFIADFSSTMRTSLETLQIDSKNGFKIQADNYEQRSQRFRSIIDTLKQMISLQKFICTSFKDLTIDEYCQLFANLDQTKIKHLSIGSCSGWFRDQEQLESMTAEQSDSLSSMFENLGKFTQLLSFKLKDIKILPSSTPLVNLFESLIIVQSLTFENIFIDKSAKITWNPLLAMLKSLPLIELRLSSSDAFTNRQIFETLIQLLSIQKRFVKIFWSITVNIDDVGHCYVPLSLDSFSTLDHDDDGHLFRENYFDFGHHHHQSQHVLPFKIVECDDQQQSRRMILIEMDTLNELIIKKVRSSFRTTKNLKNSSIGSTFQIIPQ